MRCVNERSFIKDKKNKVGSGLVGLLVGWLVGGVGLGWAGPDLI